MFPSGGQGRALEYIFAAAAAADAAEDGFSPSAGAGGGGGLLGIRLPTDATGDRLRPPRRLVVVGGRVGGGAEAALIFTAAPAVADPGRLGGGFEIATGMIVL